MLKRQELDPTYSLQQQFADTSTQTVILVNLFEVDPEDQDAFKSGWVADAEFFDANRCISAQLHQGIGASHKFLNYAVFAQTAEFAATNDQPAFVPLRRVYPDSAVAHPHLFRRLHVPGVCAGESDASVEGGDATSSKGLRHEDLDAACSLESQLEDTADLAVAQLTFFDVDPAHRADLIAAWARSATSLAGTPGRLSTQLHQGVGQGRKLLEYTMWENTAAFAAAADQVDAAAVAAGYPDGAVASPLLFRRLAIPGICVGEASGAVTYDVAQVI